MYSTRRNDYLAGGFLLALVAALIINIIASPIQEDSFRTGAIKILTEIDDHRNGFFIFVSFDIIGNFIGVAIAATLYLAFRGHNNTLAILGSFGFLTGAIVFLVSDLMFLSLGSLSEQFFAASGAQADAILGNASVVTSMLDGAIPMGATGIGLGVFFYGLLVLTTNAIPRWIGAIGIISGILSPLGWLLYVDGELIMISYIGLGFALLFALITGGWLIAKGTTEPG